MSHAWQAGVIAHPTRGKALNHWASNGSGKRDITATIKDCLCAVKVPGLVDCARKEIAMTRQNREEKEVFVRIGLMGE